MARKKVDHLKEKLKINKNGRVEVKVVENVTILRLATSVHMYQ